MGLAACGLLAFARPVAAVAADALTRVTLQLKWQHQFQFAGYYAAIAQGYYREAGLDVRLAEAQPGHDPVDAVLRGEAQFGVGTSDLVLLRAQGKPVVVLAVIYQHSPLVLLALRSSGVSDVQALANRPLMIEPDSAELFAYFRNEGVDPAKLHLVPHTFRVEDLLSGRVAAMSAYSTDEPYQLREKGADYLTFTPRAGGIDFYGDNLFTTADEIRRHPQTVRAFRAASLRGWEYAMAHADEIIDLIRRDYSRRKSRAQLQFEAAETARLIHPELIEVGHMNPGRWRHIADTYADFGMLPRHFDLAGFLYDPNPKPDLRWVYWTLGAAGALLLAALAWGLPLGLLNRRLRQEVDRRGVIEEQLRRSERQYRELVERAPFPVGVSDLETQRVLFANRRLGDLFAVDPAAAADSPAVDWYDRADDRDALLAAVRRQGAVTDMEICFRTRDGRRVWALLSAGEVAFEGRRGVVVAFHDITARRAMEEELRRAKETAEAASAAQTRYLAAMSHEIRTPMNGILGLTALLLEEAVPAEQRQSLEMIDHSARSLLKLIDDLIEWSRVEAAVVKIEEMPIVLEEFLAEITTLFRPAAEAKGLSLRHTVAAGVPPAVVSDAQRLRQILANLVTNAIQYTTRGGVEIAVDAAAGARDETGIRLNLSVHDTGIGIPPNALAGLFEPYAGPRGGPGFGLSISRKLARLLGGDLTVSSREGAGSCFVVTVAARRVETLLGHEPPAGEVRAGGPATGPGRGPLV